MADQPSRRSTPPQRGRAQPPAPGQQGWRVTPGSGRPRDPGAAPSPVAAALAMVGGGRGGRLPAGAEPVDLLAGALAQRAGAHPLQPDVPQPGKERQRQGDLLHRRFDPGHVQGRAALPVQRHERQPHHELRDAGPVVLSGLQPVEPAAVQERHHRRKAAEHRAVDVDEHHRRLRPDPAPDPAVRVHRTPRGGRRGRRGRPDVVRPLPGTPGRSRRSARDVQRRRRHRRGQGGADGDRRLPQEPRQVPQAGRPDPPRRAALRPAGNRQDTAGAGGGRRGGRAVLPDVGIGVRRDDRRRRCLARA